MTTRGSYVRTCVLSSLRPGRYSHPNSVQESFVGPPTAIENIQTLDTTAEGVESFTAGLIEKERERERERETGRRERESVSG